MSGEGNKADTPDEVIKITALLKVFSTVIRSLGEEFILSKSRMFTLAYIVEVRLRNFKARNREPRKHHSWYLNLGQLLSAIMASLDVKKISWYIWIKLFEPTSICHKSTPVTKLSLINMSRAMRKRVLCHMRTAKVQISLRIRAVWSAPLLFAA